MATAEWKKVIVSGSDAILNKLNVSTNQQIGTTQATTFLTGSFTGSFVGSGANLSGVTATFPGSNLTPLLSTTRIFSNDGVSNTSNTYVTAGQIMTGSYAGVSGDITITTGGVAAIGSGKVTSAMILDGTIADGDIANTTITNAKLANSAITIAGTSTSLGGSITAATILGSTGVFSGSAQVTGLTNANLSGTAGITNANLANSAITIAGTSTSLGGSITAATILTSTGVFSGSAQIPNTSITNTQLANSSVTVGSTAISLGQTAATIAGLTLTSPTLTTPNIGAATGTSLVLSGDLTVNGTTTVIDTTNLSVEDRFVVLNHGSGSVSPSQEGGIIIEGSTAGSGSAFYYDGDTVLRWGVALGVADNATSVTANSYVVTVSGSAANPAGNPTYGGSAAGYGNMYVNTNDNTIWIFA